MTKEKQKHNHGGHRHRLRTLIDRVGFENLSEIQMLEQILTMTNARSDTNDTAHELLKTFKTLSGVLDAQEYELKKVKGVGDITAKMLTYLPQIFKMYAKCKNKNVYSCNVYGDVQKYFRDLFVNHTNEVFIMGIINNKNKFIGYEKLMEGEQGKVTIDLALITKTILKHNVTNCIIAHNHPFSSCIASTSDVDADKQFAKLFKALGVQLYDNIIIGEDGMFSFKLNSIVERSDEV